MPDIGVLGLAAAFIVAVLAILVFNEVELGGWGFRLKGKKPERPPRRKGQK